MKAIRTVGKSRPAAGQARQNKGGIPLFVFHCDIPLDEALVFAQVVPGDMTVHLPRGKSRNCRIDFYCRSRDDARRRLLEIRQYIKGGNKLVSSVSLVKLLKKNDWAEIWKKQFKVRRVSRRIIIRPAWEKYSGRKNDCVIAVDPGMAFGTGEHATTRACLQLIDEFQRKCPEASFLDAGCGSGILAITAAKLGFKPIIAIDNDPLAVKATKINCRRNKVAGKVVCRAGDVMCFRSVRKYSLIAANLFANVLVRSAGNLAGLLDRKGHGCLILAGILEKQYDQVAEAFLSRGLREVKKIRDREWVTGVFEWNPDKI